MDFKFNLGGAEEEEEEQNLDGLNFFGGVHHHHDDELDKLDPTMQTSTISRSKREKSVEPGEEQPDYEAEIVAKCVYDEERGILNEYELLDKIGSGSFGKIVRVTRSYYEDDGVTISKSIYVFKILKKSQKIIQITDESGQSQLKKELDLLYQEIEIYKYLNNVNICKLYQIIDAPYEQTIYLVMQYCDLGQLLNLDEKDQKYYPNTKIDSFIEQTYNISEQDLHKKREKFAKIIFKQVSQGLKYLHDKKIVNRDIKIDNILGKSIECEKGENFKIIDFSTAVKLKSHHQKVFGQAGTPAYQSPEVCVKSNDGYDGKAADIWSLGITIYCYVNLCLPFLNQPDPQKLLNSISNNPIQFQTHNSALFLDLINNMCRKNPKERLKIDQVLSHQWFQE
ncbi:hypothetical protein ABPG72_007019 [Tetrahymena utriculariae]